MAISIVSSVSAMVTIGPRVYYAMAKNGAFFRSAASVHARTELLSPPSSLRESVPALMTLTPFPQLFFYIGMTLNFTLRSPLRPSLYSAVAAPTGRNSDVVSFAYPLVPLTFVLAAPG